MNFREKALKLYREGKTAKEIQKEIGVPIEMETLNKWDTENKSYDLIKDLIKKSMKLKKKLREKELLTNSQKEALNRQLKEINISILEKDPNNMKARRELFNALYNLKQWNEAEKIGQQILESDSENVVVLNKLANISSKKKEFNTAIEYLEKITQINPSNQNFKKKLEEIKQMAETVATLHTHTHGQYLKKQENYPVELEVEKEINNKPLEERLKEFANRNMAEENKYTLEAQEEYITSIANEFKKGNLKKENLKEIWEELKKYPDETKGLIFILDLYSKMTEHYIIPIKTLEMYAEEAYTLTPKEYNDILNEISRYRELSNLDKILNDREELNKKKGEQRDYSKEVIEKLKKGEINKKDIPSIIIRLQQYPDKVKSTFLISKLYEIIYDKNEALNQLANYAKSNKLNENELNMLVQMQESISGNNEKRNTTTKKLRKLYLSKDKEEKVYEKKIEKETILSYIYQGKSVSDIFEIMKDDGTSLKTISRMRKNAILKDDNLRVENARLEQIAINMFNAGFSNRQVYQLLGFDISVPRLKEIRENIKENESKEEIEK